MKRHQTEVRYNSAYRSLTMDTRISLSAKRWLDIITLVIGLITVFDAILTGRQSGFEITKLEKLTERLLAKLRPSNLVF